MSFLENNFASKEEERIPVNVNFKYYSSGSIESNETILIPSVYARIKSNDSEELTLAKEVIAAFVHLAECTDKKILQVCFFFKF